MKGAGDRKIWNNNFINEGRKLRGWVNKTNEKFVNIGKNNSEASNFIQITF